MTPAAVSRSVSFFQLGCKRSINSSINYESKHFFSYFSGARNIVVESFGGAKNIVVESKRVPRLAH